MSITRGEVEIKCGGVDTEIVAIRLPQEISLECSLDIPEKCILKFNGECYFRASDLTKEQIEDVYLRLYK